MGQLDDDIKSYKQWDSHKPVFNEREYSTSLEQVSAKIRENFIDQICKTNGFNLARERQWVTEAYDKFPAEEKSLGTLTLNIFAQQLRMSRIHQYIAVEKQKFFENDPNLVASVSAPFEEEQNRLLAEMVARRLSGELPGKSELLGAEGMYYGLTNSGDGPWKDHWKDVKWDPVTWDPSKSYADPSKSYADEVIQLQADMQALAQGFIRKK